MTPILKLPLLSVMASVCFCAGAQSYMAKKIVFKNAGPYGQEQLEGVCGIHPGMKISRDALAAGAQKLADTGRFSDVGAIVDGPPSGYTVIYTLKPMEDTAFLPAGFENFVWLTPAEIRQSLAEKLPLYDGRVMEAGTEPDAVDAALVAALAAKGVTAKVEHETVEPTLRHPARVMEFRVVTPVVYVASLKLESENPELTPLFEASAKKMVGHRYDDGLAGKISSDLLLAPVRNAGYAKATLGTVTFDPLVVTENKVPLVLHASLVSGAIYHVAALAFAGAPLYSAEEFAKTAQLHAGDVASEDKLVASLQPVDMAYRDKGYNDVIVKAIPTFDDTAKTVSYTVSVTPGEVYRVHEVNAQGLDDVVKGKFDAQFGLRPGDAYSPVYVQKFMAEKFVPAGYVGSWRAIADPSTHTVDLSLSFVRPGQSVQQRVVVR